MNNLIDSGPTFRDRISTEFQLIDKIDMLNNSLQIIDHRKEEIEQHHVIFWHRLLKSIYGEPLEIECELRGSGAEAKVNMHTATFRKTQTKNKWDVSGIDSALVSEIEAGVVKPHPINWKYLIRLPSGGIVELGTGDRTTRFYIARVLLSNSNEHVDIREAKKLIDLLLGKANIQAGKLFNPKKEFERQASTKTYLLFNVYLSNYLSANLMLDIARSKEIDLGEELLKHDARASHWNEKMNLTLQHLITKGMFYCSSIAYYIMALEGFVNLVYHAFLKRRFRDKEFRIDQRLDWEQKLRFMPALCQGFHDNSELSSVVFSDFTMLRNYRNSLFHSKVEDSLKNLSFVEDGFLYTYDMDTYKERFLPSFKGNLTIEDVAEVKSKVDEIVQNILALMNQDTRMITEAYLLNEPIIPFKILETGELKLPKKESIVTTGKV